MADEVKKKAHYTSTAAKYRYNQKTYAQVTCLLPKQLVADFKAKCKEKGDTQAQIIRSAIEAYLKANEVK